MRFSKLVATVLGAVGALLLVLALTYPPTHRIGWKINEGDQYSQIEETIVFRGIFWSEPREESSHYVYKYKVMKGAWGLLLMAGLGVSVVAQILGKPRGSQPSAHSPEEE